jgi:hypothetical protein
MSKALPKEIQIILRQIASKLPNVFYTVQESQQWNGKDLLLTGIQKQADDQPIDPDKDYWIDSPVHISSNHYRRMKKAWLNGGNEAVSAYVAKVNLLQSQSKN